MCEGHLQDYTLGNCSGHILLVFHLLQATVDFQETSASITTFQASLPLTNLGQAINSEVTRKDKLSNGTRTIQLHFLRNKNYPQIGQQF